MAIYFPGNAINADCYYTTTVLRKKGCYNRENPFRKEERKRSMLLSYVAGCVYLD